MGGLVVVGIQLSSGGESEALSFHLWQSWWETQFWHFNSPSSVTHPRRWRSAKPEKKDKRHYFEKVRDMEAALEALGGGLHAKYEI